MTGHGMKKELTLLDLIFICVSGIIGTGWLLAAQSASKIAGPAAIISWLIGGGAILLIILIYAELASMLPEPGGTVRYPQYSHGSLTGFIMGWTCWLSWVTTPAAEATGITQYASRFFPNLYNTHTGLLTPSGIFISIVLIVIFFGINYIGVKFFARINTSLTWFKFLMPVLTIFLLIAFGFHKSNFGHYGGFFFNGPHTMLMAVGTSGIIFAISGFRHTVDMAGEARNPQRDVPVGLIVGVLISVGIYALLQVAFVGAVPRTELVRGWNSLSMSAPFAQLALLLNLSWFAILLQVDAMVSPAGTALVSAAGNIRAVYAMSENGTFPGLFSKVDAKRHIPINSLLFNGVVAILLLIPFKSWMSIIGFMSVASIVSYMIAPVAASVLRRTAPEIRRPFRLKGIRIISPLAFIVASLIVYWSGWPTTLYAVGCVIVGLIIYSYYFAKKQLPISDLRAGAWLVLYLVFVIAYSYVGSKDFGGTGFIKTPYDVLIFAVISLIFYYWGVASGYRTGDIENEMKNREPVSDLSLPLDGGTERIPTHI